MTAEDEFDLYSQLNLGALEIALAITLVLFGFLLHQVYDYLKTYNDRLFLKLLAVTILILEVSHTVVIVQTIFYPTVTMYGNPHIEPDSYPMTTSVVFEVIITFLVQGFFAYRIYRLSEQLLIPTLCWFLSLLRFGGGLALSAESYLNLPKQVFDTFALTDNFGWLITLSITVGAFVDILIAVSLCYYIKRLAPVRSSRRVVALINRLMVWVIQTGLVTSIASVVVIITFYAFRNTVLWFSIYMILAKLYSNSFFMTLNVRRRHDAEYIDGTFDGFGIKNKPVLLPTYNTQKSCVRLNSSFSSQQTTPETYLNLPSQLRSKNSFCSAINRGLAERGLAILGSLNGTQISSA